MWGGIGCYPPMSDPFRPPWVWPLRPCSPKKMENRGLHPSGSAARPLAAVSPASPTPALAEQSDPPAVPWLRCCLPRKAAAPFAAVIHLKKTTRYFEEKRRRER